MDNLHVLFTFPEVAYVFFTFTRACLLYFLSQSLRNVFTFTSHLLLLLNLVLFQPDDWTLIFSVHLLLVRGCTWHLSLLCHWLICVVLWVVTPRPVLDKIRLDVHLLCHDFIELVLWLWYRCLAFASLVVFLFLLHGTYSSFTTWRLLTRRAINFSSFVTW